jgi:hypothetical protein
MLTFDKFVVSNLIVRWCEECCVGSVAHIYIPRGMELAAGAVNSQYYI